MARLIITTVGISIITKENEKIWVNYKDEIKSIKNGRKPLRYDACVDFTVKNLFRIFKQHHASNSHLSAELASLCVLKDNDKIDEDDKIVLLSTETMGGQFCADVNKKVLDMLKWCNVSEPTIIKGFKTKKTTENDENISESFTIDGLNNLKKQVEKLVITKNEDNYFNITGGYKAIIPFSTIVAFSKSMSLMYLYEGSDDLIIVPPPKKFTCSFNDVIKNTNVMKYGRGKRPGY